MYTSIGAALVMEDEPVHSVFRMKHLLTLTLGMSLFHPTGDADITSNGVKGELRLRGFRKLFDLRFG